MKTFAKYASVSFVFFMVGTIVTSIVFSSFVKSVERIDHVRGLGVLEELIFSLDEKSGCANTNIVIEKYEKMALMGPDFTDITVVDVLFGAYMGGASIMTESAYIDHIRRLKYLSRKKQQNELSEAEAQEIAVRAGGAGNSRTGWRHRK